MRIERLEVYPVELPRREPFVTSQHRSDVAGVVFLRLDIEGIEGWGAASPGTVTGETAETVADALDRFATGLKGLSFDRGREISDRLDALLQGNPAAKAAVDMAAFDALAKSRERPLHHYLGTEREKVMTDRTVSLLPPDEAAAKAKEYVADGFRAIKVKLAGSAGEDVARVEAIRTALGDHILLRADANQAFGYRSALRFSRQAYPLMLEFFEQPLAADDLQGMRDLTEASPIPIMADESVASPGDAAKVAWGRCARLVNLKLMKVGGISKALEANAICESAGMPTMVGCNAESSLSIAAAVHVAMAQKNVRFADLDSHFNLVGDPASGLAFDDGWLTPSDRPGLGMDVRL